MSDFIKGEDLVLSIHDGTIYRPIACLTANSLSKTRGVIEAQTKCSPGVTEKSVGAMAYNISCEGLYIDTTSAGTEITKASHDYLDTVIDAGLAVTWRMDTGLADKPYYYGSAVITALDLNAPAGNEFANFSATLDGSGAIVSVDPEA